MEPTSCVCTHRYELYGERVWTNREAAQPFMLETNEAEYQKLRVMLNEVKSIADFQDTYLSMSGVIVMLLILRLLKLLDFQPRLGLVTRTLARAAADLSHFSMLFVAVVGGFSITGHVLFGSRCAHASFAGPSEHGAMVVAAIVVQHPVSCPVACVVTCYA